MILFRSEAYHTGLLPLDFEENCPYIERWAGLGPSDEIGLDNDAENPYLVSRLKVGLFR